MPDVTFTNAFTTQQTPPSNDQFPGEINEAVCIDANRVYDSCGDKDCLSDMRVFFTETNQAVVNNACNVRIREANVIYTTVNLEPVTFHKGFYAVDMTFFFEIILDAFMAPGSLPTTINGLSIFSKRVILYGSEGNVKIFSSDTNCDECSGGCGPYSMNLPKATVQIAQPMALSASLTEVCGQCIPSCRIPNCVASYFGGDLIPPNGRTVKATIGIFTIVQIERNVQMLIPAYDFCIPKKECVTSSDNPCEMFSRIDFPTDEFFPPRVTDLPKDEFCNRAE